MSILIRTGTIRAKVSARCAVCGGTGVHVGVTAAHLGGEPEFYHYGCMVKRDNVTELVWTGTQTDGHMATGTEEQTTTLQQHGLRVEHLSGGASNGSSRRNDISLQVQRE